MTAPFAAEVAEVVKVSHRQRVRASAFLPSGQEVPLEVEDYAIEWTERRSPRVTADLTCAVPDEATLNQLDPRTFVRVKVWAAYWLPLGDGWDEQLVASLHLRWKQVTRPANTMVLRCASAEALLIDQDNGALGDPVDSTTDTRTAGQWIQWMSEAYLLGTPSASMPWAITAADGATNVYVVDNAPSFWDTVLDLVDRRGLDVYDDGLGTMYVVREPVLATPRHELVVGQDGTIDTTDSTTDRELWANLVLIDYGDGHVGGRAQVTAGPYAPAAAHYKLYSERRTGKPSQASANAAAATVLRRLLSRSKGLNLEAVSAWWLRPGHTVTVQLPTGGTQQHLVATVTFRNGGRMSVATRVPDTVSTIGE